MQQTANFYVDGFNLYYGSLKTRWPEYKWLDLQSFCEGLAPGGCYVKRVRYFTARVKNWVYNPAASDRQHLYLRALGTLPKVSIHYGSFTMRRPKMPLFNNPSRDAPALVRVLRAEEKRSDVNLASWLLVDCYENDCDVAIVISNDSDLATPVEIVRDRIGKKVGVINPRPSESRSGAMEKSASWSMITIDRSHFESNQMTRELSDTRGTFSKPASWE